jgi:hypothetical protein
VALLDRLHAAQNALYGGGEEQDLRALLDPGITWTVPGASTIGAIIREAKRSSPTSPTDVIVLPGRSGCVA